ncbi:hemerythrin domain-containing protein [Streptomyces sp. NPDC018833]|uniref:hemerythrin domain-containing protein n=1 Tax=Streptomyces sp. NPDC018833 TaxID=3365053 RepID=UPI0037B932C0
MCEYCGCQAVAAIEELTREHDTVVDLIGRVRSAHSDGDIPRMAELARQISAVLAPHTEVEEHGLFPAMATEFPDHIAALEAEHRRIEAVLAQAADGVPGDSGWPTALVEALAMLREHILKEQDGLFPASLTFLTPEQWDVLDAVRARSAGATASPAR